MVTSRSRIKSLDNGAYISKDTGIHQSWNKEVIMQISNRISAVIGAHGSDNRGWFMYTIPTGTQMGPNTSHWSTRPRLVLKRQISHHRANIWILKRNEPYFQVAYAMKIKNYSPRPRIIIWIQILWNLKLWEAAFLICGANVRSEWYNMNKYTYDDSFWSVFAAKNRILTNILLYMPPPRVLSQVSPTICYSAIFRAYSRDPSFFTARYIWVYQYV